jgi:hypothetical protein
LQRKCFSVPYFHCKILVQIYVKGDGSSLKSLQAPLTRQLWKGSHYWDSNWPFTSGPKYNDDISLLTYLYRAKRVQRVFNSAQLCSGSCKVKSCIGVIPELKHISAIAIAQRHFPRDVEHSCLPLFYPHCSSRCLPLPN